MRYLRLEKPAKNIFAHFLFWAILANLIVRFFFLYWNYAEFTDGYLMIDIRRLGVDQRLPFYPFFSHFLSFLISEREISAKIISMLMGSLGCLPVYFAAKELYNKRAGCFAVLLFSCSPLLFPWSIRIATESNFIFFMCCSYLYCVKYIKKTTLLNLSLAVFFSGLCLLSRPEGLLFLPILFLMYLHYLNKIFRQIQKKKKLPPKVIGAKIAIIFLSLIPFFVFLIWISHQNEFMYGSMFVKYNSKPNPGRSLIHLLNYIKIFPHIIAWPVFALWIYGHMADLKNRLCRLNRPILLLDLYLFAAIFFTMSIHRFWTTRHIMMLIPLVVIGSAGGLSICFKKIKNVEWTYFILAICLVFSAALATASLIGSREFFKDIKVASEYIRDHLPEQRIYAMGGSIYKVKYWSKNSNIHKYDRNNVKPGQFILLNDFYYDNHGSRVNNSFVNANSDIAYLEKHFEVTVLFRTFSQVTPFLGDYTFLHDTVFGELRSIYLPFKDPPLFKTHNFESVLLEVEGRRGRSVP